MAKRSPARLKFEVPDPACPQAWDWRTAAGPAGAPLPATGWTAKNVSPMAAPTPFSFGLEGVDELVQTPVDDLPDAGIIQLRPQPAQPLLGRRAERPWDRRR